MKIRRALLSVSDKSQIETLAKALKEHGAELVATGRTAEKIKEAGLDYIPIEKVSGSPEAFQGRMKTLSFNVCSGILFRRGDGSDEADVKALKVPPIDCVVVNFYPFEKAASNPGVTEAELIEQIDIGGPTLVRAAAKNAPSTLVLSDPAQYDRAIEEMRAGEISEDFARGCARTAWSKIAAYDNAIDRKFNSKHSIALRYGENPHQTASLEVREDSPINWQSLTENALSYNNILDLTAAYDLVSELSRDQSSVVIVKHNNPCGVASFPRGSGAQRKALERAWQGDPVSAFGGVLCFSDPLEEDSMEFLGERFIELVAAPELNSGALEGLLKKRKKLKAVEVRRFGGAPSEQELRVPGGVLRQTQDHGPDPEFKSVTKTVFPDKKFRLAHFGINVGRALKSNCIAIVREVPGAEGAYQLIGAGQGQPNRVEALKDLALPRARRLLRDELGASERPLREALANCIMISDAFFPFRDTVDVAFEGGIRSIVQPGGSIKDKDSIAACDEREMTMAFTGRRHFRH